MSYQRDLEYYMHTMGRNNVSAAMAEEIRRLSQIVHTQAVNACNQELTKRQRSRMRNAVLRLEALGKELGVKVDCDGDPRGYTVKLHLPDGSYNTWGGKESGYGVPVRG